MVLFPVRCSITRTRMTRAGCTRDERLSTRARATFRTRPRNPPRRSRRLSTHGRAAQPSAFAARAGAGGKAPRWQARSRIGVGGKASRWQARLRAGAGGKASPSCVACRPSLAKIRMLCAVRDRTRRRCREARARPASVTCGNAGARPADGR